jgi:hypothetical protein
MSAPRRQRTEACVPEGPNRTSAGFHRASALHARSLERQLPAFVADGRRVKGALRRNWTGRGSLPEPARATAFRSPVADEQWRKVRIGETTVWDSLDHGHRDLLTPNLPNVFLAVVPEGCAAELGAVVENAIRAEWKNIANKVWAFCDGASAGTDRVNLTADEDAISRDWIEYVTSDHRRAGSSPSGGKTGTRAD